MVKNAGRLSAAERVAIRVEAERIDARRDSL